MSPELIQAIADAGFDVYMRDEKDTFGLFSDGTNIGYVQDDGWRGVSLSSVHVANRTSGTGYGIRDRLSLAQIDATILSEAFISSPGWAGQKSRSSVRKYANITEYLNENSFNAKYKLVAAGKRI